MRQYGLNLARAANDLRQDPILEPNSAELDRWRREVQVIRLSGKLNNSFSYIGICQE